MTETSTPSEAPAKSGWLKRLAPLALIAVGLVTAYLLGLHRYLSLDALEAQRETLTRFVADHLVLALLCYVLIYALATTFSLPGAAFLTIAGGFMFGMWLGGAAALVGATTGATIIFLIAKTSLGEGLRQKAGGFTAKLRKGFEKNAFNYLLTLRLIPAAPFFIVNLVPAFFGMRTRDFVIASAIGMIPGALVYASFGAAAGVAFDKGETPNLSLLARPELLFGIVGLIVLSLLPLLLKKVSKTRTPDTGATQGPQTHD